MFKKFFGGDEQNQNSNHQTEFATPDRSFKYTDILRGGTNDRPYSRSAMNGGAGT